MTQQLADFLEVFTDVNKTAIMFILLIISVILRCKGIISSDGFVELAKTTTIAYFGTTSVVHFTSMIRDSLISKNSGKSQ